MVKSREIWVDNVKIIACILVVLGHFFQSMVAAGIMNDTSLYRWFNQTIYMFHIMHYKIEIGKQGKNIQNITLKIFVRVAFMEYATDQGKG